MRAEEWRAAPGFPAYEVSSAGRLRSVDRVDARGAHRKGRIMRPGVSNGYSHAKLWRDGRKHGVNLHPIVAEAFLGARPFPEAVARHLDDVGTNNDVSNLAWGTVQQNAEDAVRNGRHFNSRGVCKKGLHAMDGDNVAPNGKTRLCRACRRESQRDYHSNRKGASRG